MPRGSITPKPERGEDAWQVQASAGSDPITGNRIRRTRLVHGTRADAERALTALLAEIDERPQATEGTVGYLLEAWYAANAPGWSPTTAHGYRALIDGRLSELADVKLRDLSLEKLERFYLRLRTRDGLRHSTVRNHHAVMRASLKFACKRKWLSANPAAGAKIPPDSEPSQVDPPTAIEMREVLDHLRDEKRRNPELATFLRFALDTGLRRGELCGLQWRAVDLTRREMVVRQTVVQYGQRMEVRSTTKTKRKRQMRLATNTVRLLEIHREKMEARAEAGGTKLARDAFVFSNSLDGSEPWKPKSVTQAVGRALRKVDVNGRLHDTRHFMATEWLQRGVDVLTVSKRLGHALPSTTVNIYGHGRESAEAEAAELMGDHLGEVE